MMNIYRYIFFQCMLGVFLTLSVISSAIILIDVVEQMRTIGSRTDIGILQALRLSAFKLPLLIEQTAPFIILIGAILTFYRLNQNSELTAMRSVGVSVWQFFIPLATLALILSVLTATIINPSSAYFAEQFERIRAQLLQSDSESPITVSSHGIWLRQNNPTGKLIIHANDISQNSAELIQVKIFEFENQSAMRSANGEFRFIRRIDAERAQLLPGFWQLENVVESLPGDTPIHQKFLSFRTDLEPDKLLDRFASPKTIGFWQLPDFIHKMREAGLDVTRYQMRFFALLASPVLFVSMALVGVLMCLRMARSGRTSTMVALGILIALIFFFITELSNSLGAAGAIHPIIAAWCPPLSIMFGTLAMIAYREDG